MVNLMLSGYAETVPVMGARGVFFRALESTREDGEIRVLTVVGWTSRPFGRAAEQSSGSERTME